MKNLLDIVLGTILFIFSILIWIFKSYYPMESMDIDESMHLIIIGVLLVAFVIMYSIYISHSKFIPFSMITMLVSTIVWSSSLKSVIYLMGDSPDMYINIFGFLIMLGSFIQTFHRQLKNT